jgi:hypothetical protein
LIFRFANPEALSDPTKSQRRSSAFKIVNLRSPRITRVGHPRAEKMIVALRNCTGRRITISNQAKICLLRDLNGAGSLSNSRIQGKSDFPASFEWSQPFAGPLPHHGRSMPAKS